MAITKEKLEILQPSFDDTCVVGINSGLPDYKLAWLINNKLPIQLERQDDIVKNGGVYPFYTYFGGENDAVYNLVATSYDKKSIFNLSVRVDYLFIIRGEVSQQRIDFILKKIQEIDGIAFLMDGQKSRLETTLYDIEQHQVELDIKARQRNTVEYVKEEIRQRRIFLGVDED